MDFDRIALRKDEYRSRVLAACKYSNTAGVLVLVDVLVTGKRTVAVPDSVVACGGNAGAHVHHHARLRARVISAVAENQ